MNVELKEFEEENNPYMRIIEKKFESFTRPQQIKHLEVEGYLIIPKVLNELRDLKSNASNKDRLDDLKKYYEDISYKFVNVS